MNYRIARRAHRDIEAICDRIALDNPSAAEKLDLNLHEQIKRLADMPRMGHQRVDVLDDRYRFWPVGNYVIAYRVDKASLIVVRVVHGARDFRTLF